ncbi:MAG TPA: DUF2017 family protein [Acidimicrobiia bacterium]|nr:DUF2017 family protein [Acidimicrobiia bacterium]
MARSPFRRNRAAGYDVVLEAGEAAVLTRLCEELTTLLSDDPGDTAGLVEVVGDQKDPVLDRLFPRAYLDPTEEAAEADWQRLVHGDLVDGRRRALATVEGTLASAEVRKGRFELTLDEEQAQAWLAVLNDARLALGTRLEVTEDLDLSGLDPNDPDTAPFAVYWWLGVLEERLVDALSGSL